MKSQHPATPLAGSERPRPPTHKRVGPARPEDLIGVTLLLRARPGSPPLPTLDDWYKIPLRDQRFLTADEYARVHGAAEADLNAVAAFAAAHGLKVAESHAGRRSVVVDGTVGQMEAAFGVTLQRFKAPLPSARRARRGGEVAKGPAREVPAETHVHNGYDGAVQLPANLAGVVVAVIGLDDRRLSVPAGGTGDPAGATTSQVPTVAGWYNFPVLGAADQTIGVHAPSPAAYLRSDITGLYFPGLTNPNYQTPPGAWNDVALTVSGTPFTNVTGPIASITPSTPNATLNSLPDSFILELTQDISTSATIAQGATMNVYFTQDSEQGWITFLNRVLQPQSGTLGEPQPTVLTSSFPLQLDDGGLGDPTNPSTTAGAMGTLFQALGALGIQLFSGIGDWGSNDRINDGGLHVSYPGSDPAVTACGGTVLSHSPNFLEYVWSDGFNTTAQFGGGIPANSFGATGGGVSANFTAAPTYQTTFGVSGATDSKGTVHTGRAVPDVSAMVAYNGFFLNGSTGINYSFVGTSCVAPLYAGLMAVMRSAVGRSLGPLNNLFYQLAGAANSPFLPVTFGNNDSNDPSNDSPYFSASAGNTWNACTGLGSVDGTKLLNAITSLLYNPTYYFQVNKGSFGLNEVNLNLTYASPTPLWLVLEGFAPNIVTAANVTPIVTSLLGGVTVTVGTPQYEIATALNTPQRIYFPCTVVFAAADAKTIAQGGIFPDPGTPPTPTQATLVSPSLLIAGQILPAAQTTLTLEQGDDPYFSNFANNGYFYLSQDLRVFTVTPAVNNAPIAGVALNVPAGLPWATGAAYTYIQKLLKTLNAAPYNSPSGTDPFITQFPDQTSALSGDSSVTPSVPGPSGQTYANYNFAVARVRVDGTPGQNTGARVRVLFRVFASQTSDTDFQALTYPSSSDSEGQPLAPQLSADSITIPFFATGNYEGNSDYQVNNDYPLNGDTINNQPVPIGSSGQAWAYYGCYLNFYPPDNTVTTPAPIGKTAVQNLLPSSHSCVVAQLIYDDAPAPTGPGVLQGPEYSDNFAQRNLQITFSDNPGPAAAHRVPQTFDVRPSPAPGSGALENYPDELMIEWGNTPVGSVASVYWPAVASSEVLALATKFYFTHQLSASDPHTIQCTVPEGITFIPIPTGSGQNFAGLFTLDLPHGVHGVKDGQIFTITVRRISTFRAPVAPPPPPQPKLAGRAASGTVVVRVEVNQGPPTLNWRYVVGSFAVRIPVTTAAGMRPVEENTLSLMKWRLSNMSPANRWVPVLKRYIGFIEGRLQGIGVDPNSIKPSPYGASGPPKRIGSGGSHRGDDGCGHDHDHEATGKVNGVIYDRFGDFEGFCLLSEEGCERRYWSREHEIEELIRYAWVARVVITVFSWVHEQEVPIKIILRHAPPPSSRPD